MDEFHYVRIPGVDGGVDCCAGPAVGIELETVLAAGVPPWKVGLELVAALCEILDIADADEVTHGLVEPQFIFLDEKGALCLEGFGVPRASNAPNAKPGQRASDRYGLGYTALRILSARPVAFPFPQTSAKDHDDAAIDAVLEMDLAGLDQAMQEDVQWFLAKLMSFEPSERPSALDAWRTFIAFAATTAGPELASWASDVVAGGGERRAVGRQPTIAPEPLGNPTRLPGPMPTPMAFSETNEVLFQPYNTLSSSKPPRGVGGGTATAYWKPEQLAAMSQGREDAPKPSRKEPEPSAPLEFEEVQTPLAVPTATLSADEKGGLFLEYVVAGASVDQLDFSRANLRGARLDGADLSGATLDRADLREASLRGASLTGTVLARSNLVRADLRRASLEKADLHNAHLLEANLEEASLYQANLSRADVVGANLSATNLRGVDLSTTQVRFAQITPETYRKSKWTFEELAELHERGASIGGLADELARAAKPGLTLYFRTGLSDLDHAAVLVLLHEFKVLHPDSDLRLAEFENTGTRARLNIRGSNEDHLALVAEWLQQRPWEPPSQTRPSSSNELVPLDTRPFAGPNAEQISFVWDRTGRMELWRRVSNRLVRLKTYNNDPPSALLLHYRLLVTAFTPSELERLVPLHRADVALEVNFSGSSKAVASQVASVMERCVVSLDWFRVLMTERPLLAGQIAFVAATYGFQDMGLIETAQAR